MDIKKKRTFKISLVSFIPLLLALPIFSVAASNTITSSSYSPPTYNQMMHALENLLQYYERNAEHIIVDAYYGLKVTTALIQQTIHSYENGKSKLEEKQIDRLKQIYQDALRISKRIEETSGRNSSAYMKHSKMLHTSFPFPERLAKLELVKDTPNNNGNSSINFIKISDQCLWDMMGGGLRHPPVCTINDSCWRGLTDFSTEGYIITHQFLLIFVGEQFNCTEKMNQLSQNLGGIEKVKQALCTRIYYQMTKALEKGLVTGKMQDLFIEQIYICGGTGGYQQFLRPEFLSMILKWRTKDGCFSPYHGQYISLHPKLARNGGISDIYHLRKTRKLLANLISPDGCHEHMTALAMIDIALYLRWLSFREQLLTTTFTSVTDVSKSISVASISKSASLSPGIVAGIVITIVVIAVIISLLFVYFANPFHRERQGYRVISSR